MSNTAIRVEGLSKQYRIGKMRERYGSLRDSLANAATAPIRAVAARCQRNGVAKSRDEDTVWALRDVSFEVQRGDVVGVIGRNGAGKSTLLKILSRITEPTLGYAQIHGRIASLLEVGTGFNQELTGRENIYLNGAILGMKRAEIDRKFDDMVDFAEVEKFIDTAVKHYSSGMYLRLAFAVAAHLEPEILLVDEVLAVGDAAFQKKCLGKMEDVAKQGRTVLFVSHNMGAVRDLCQQSLVINAGQLAFAGAVDEGVMKYAEMLQSSDSAGLGGGTSIALGVVRVNDGRGSAIGSHEPMELSVPIHLREELSSAWLYCILEDFRGNTVIHDRINVQDLGVDSITDGDVLTVRLPGLWLAPGVYTVHFKVLATSARGENGRAVSERVMIDVVGEFERTGRAVLSPPVGWELAESALLTKAG